MDYGNKILGSQSFLEKGLIFYEVTKILNIYCIITEAILCAGYQPTNANYKIQMAELGGLAETLVLSLALVENHLTEKLWVLKALQHLSSSG